MSLSWLQINDFFSEYLRLEGDAFLLDLGQFVGDLLLGLNLTLQVGLQVEQLHLVQALRPPVAPPWPILHTTHTPTFTAQAFVYMKTAY